ncbi:MAG: ATP-dependent Clp protease ATP-binding subunit ClpX [Firmicutes bacterium]|nr:ATP-dependent Clp protease ATP-binding subunit ClpX [Bacillota bacterium]
MTVCALCKVNAATNKIGAAGNIPVCQGCLARMTKPAEGAKTVETPPVTVASKPIPEVQPTEDGAVPLPAPEELRKHLDDYVIGQDDAKRVLSVAVYNHYKRVNFNLSKAPLPGGGHKVELSKSNILMIGPTGTGKTHITNTLAKALGVPFASVDATSIIANGVKEIESFIFKLLQNADFDVERAERGIVYIDEIDKITARHTKEGHGIQQALLKTIEGSVATIAIPHLRKRVDVNTLNILFIVGGAHVGLDSIVHERTGIGMMNFGHGGTEADKLIKDVTPGDLARYGYIPEFIGRIPVTVGLHGLGEDALIDILTEPKNAIVKQYKQMFAMENVDLEFTREALLLVAAKALALKTGARGLRTIIEDAMLETMYSVPGMKNLLRVIVTADVINKVGTPRLEFIQAREDEPLPELAIKTPRTKTATL